MAASLTRDSTDVLIKPAGSPGRLGRPRMLTPADGRLLAQIVTEFPTASVAILTTHLCERLDRRVAPSTVDGELKRLGLRHSQRGTKPVRATSARVGSLAGAAATGAADAERPGSEAPSSPPRPRRPMGRPLVLSAADRAVLEGMAEELPGASIAVLTKRFCARIGRQVSPNTIERATKKMGVCPSQHGRATDQGASQASEPPSPSKATRHKARHRPVVPKDGGYPSDLTDAELGLVETLLKPKRQRSAGTSARATLNALMYVTRTGCQWRYLPRDFPPWKSVAKQFYRRVQRGVLDAINTALRKKIRLDLGREPDPSAGIVDSQSVKTIEKGGSAGTTEASR